MVLIVSSHDDAHVLAVMAELRRRRAPAVLLDLASVPVASSLSITSGGGQSFEASLCQTDGQRLDFTEVGSVWWRRPQPYRPHSELSQGHAAYAFEQVHAAMAGLWSALPVRLVNDPWSHLRADQKVGQLRDAAELGMIVPATLVTSSPTAAREFLARLEGTRVVRKALRATKDFAPETQVLAAGDHERLDALRFSPCILQEYVPGVDLRVTVIGSAVFAALIDPSETSSPHDFRPVFKACKVETARLPDQIEKQVIALVRRLGLVYAAVDLRRDAEGRHFFLEANPAGQWLFVEQRTGQKISACLAAALACRPGRAA